MGKLRHTTTPIAMNAVEIHIFLESKREADPDFRARTRATDTLLLDVGYVH